MWNSKDNKTKHYDIDCIRKAYYAVKEICYECVGDCKNCKVGQAREDLVDIEKTMAMLIAEEEK